MATGPNTVLLTIDQGGDLRPNYRSALIITFVAAAVAIVLRFWSRRLSGTRYGWDDWLALLVFCVAIVQPILGGLWLNVRGEEAIGAITEARLRAVLRLVFAEELCYTTIIFLTRASALVLWTRLFHQKHVRWYCWFWRVVNVLWYTALFITICVQCVPTWVFWEPFTTKYVYAEVCKVDIKKLFVAGAISSIVADIAVIGLPLVLCWRLNLNLAAKLMVCGMFATGFFVTIISGVRLQAVLSLDLKDIMETLNPTWTFSRVSLWSNVEGNIGIVSICLPVLRPALAKLVPKSWVPSSLRKRSITPYSVFRRYKNRGMKMTEYSSNDDTVVDSNEMAWIKSGAGAARTSTELPSEHSRGGAEYDVESNASSRNRDALDGSESGIVETAPGAFAPSDWTGPNRVSPQTHVQVGDSGSFDPRFVGIMVERSIQVNSEKNSIIGPVD